MCISLWRRRKLDRDVRDALGDEIKAKSWDMQPFASTGRKVTYS
jgi:hypothetical protein